MRLFRALAKTSVFMILPLAMLFPRTNTALGQSSSTPAPCASPQNRQFDFWVGRWDVYPKKTPNKKVAQSLIERLYSGCAIRENWMPLMPGGDGGSINSYRAEDGLWHQTWTDSTGAWVEFTGKW